MPNNTPYAQVPEPLGNELMTRAAHNVELDAVELALRRPFFTIAAIDGSSNLVFTLEKGRGQVGPTLVVKSGTSTVTVVGPTPGATYYLYLKSDGTWVTNTTGLTPAGHLPICSAVVPNPIVPTTPLAVTDLRSEISAPPTGLTQDAMDPSVYWMAGVVNNNL